MDFQTFIDGVTCLAIGALIGVSITLAVQKFVGWGDYE